jgi:RimJ/RimL family protein N-acetyltransferase
MNIIEVRTSRLTLRQWRDSDLELFAQLNADPRVMEYFPSTLDREESDAGAIRARSSIAEHGWGFWAAELIDTNQFIGFVGIKPNADMPFSPCVEIGWRLAFDYWHKGYATEAALAALQVGFEQLHLPEIVSFTAVLNRRSQAVMQRLGMHRDNETFQHPAIPAGNRLREHVLYRFLLEDWKKIKLLTKVNTP